MLWVYYVTTVVILIVETNTISAECNLKNGQCVYDMHLGQQGQCDSVPVQGSNVHTSGSSGLISGSCTCDDVWQVTNHMKTIQKTEKDLKQLLAELHQHMDNATAELNSTDSQLKQKQQQNVQLQTTLNSKETSLNETKVHLNNVLNGANTDLNALRGNLAKVRRDLTSCQTSLGVPVTNSLATNAVFSTFYCGFEISNLCGFTQDRHDNADWTRSHQRESTGTGPQTDHTYGNHHGNYMVLKASSPSRSSAGTTTSRIESPSFQPASNYCVRFWYTLFGKDIKTFNVYVKVHGGMGYPVFSRTGNIDSQWHLGEVSLDREYTGAQFQIVFEGTHNAYKVSHYHSGGHYTYDYYHEKGNIAIDDVFVYNTSCSQIPAQPLGSLKHQGLNHTSYYTFHTKAMAWYDASKACKKEDARSSLARVTDAAEQNYLVNMIQSDVGLTAAGQMGFFINGNDYDNEASYKWTSTGYPESLNYTNWHPGQPNNVGDNQDCILMQYPESNYEWGDVSCTESHPFICETIM